MSALVLVWRTGEARRRGPAVPDRHSSGRAVDDRVRDSVWPLHEVRSAGTRTRFAPNLRCHWNGWWSADRTANNRSGRPAQQSVRTFLRANHGAVRSGVRTSDVPVGTRASDAATRAEGRSHL